VTYNLERGSRFYEKSIIVQMVLFSHHHFKQDASSAVIPLDVYSAASPAA